MTTAAVVDVASLCPIELGELGCEGRLLSL